MSNVMGGRSVPGGQPVPGGQSVPARSNGFSVTGLVLGIVGIFVAQVILGPLAIIFGAIGWNRANHGAKGKGLSIAAVVLGIVDLILLGVVLGGLGSNNGFAWHI
ncbi:DUF4190 domain-containing protein [Rugosimonospora africana]|uniref:DUF4190 domain-containing protein n=1 Tax=Rugosimonospora africana TaxID=556532 RepID=A0A8J3QN13_9ACTN|nr:hypothetical protein [Rugosimonospora africana]GIH12919.1 hypothetical protein Raf01_10910 [Rugosimonospora africana]